VTNNIEEAIYLSDRIVLLKECPTASVKEYDVTMPKPRDYTDPDFLALRELITSDIEKLVAYNVKE
jgi:NitT/TauT family transport system ATP-binding protein/sulfonate transport system ATP-binding protein